MTEIPKAYDPSQVEDRWYARWLEEGCFTADPKRAFNGVGLTPEQKAAERARGLKEAYSIVIPPPNVTGVLTMGHVLNNTIQDILARKARMEGGEVLWLPGTDHAGIATQTVVEKTLRKQGVMKHRDDLGREKFLEHVWQWKEKHGGIIIQQLKKLGASCDWTRERFTMDPEYSRCVQRVFVDLYGKGFIYRGKRMVNWDPAARTALSDEEVVMTEEKGHLWHIKYPFLDEKGNPLANEFMVVATTRPETMLGDEAVAVNPKDARYQKQVGRRLMLPLQNKAIPVIADELVDPKFGTGCVKVTPAHDLADYEMGVRHKLPITVVIGPDGVMTSEAGEDFMGMDRMEARQAVVEELEEQKLLLKVEDYVHSVGYSDRSHVPIEPYLSEQWFLRYPSVKVSTDAVEKGVIRFFPERWSKTYTHWMSNIKDWCISRQLWWGHQIPVWYHKKTREIHCDIEPPKDAENWEQDPDVLDTWFSSWLWPFATMGWPEKTETLKRFYPTSDLVTGPDIIFFWVARMIMAGYEYMGDLPFQNVYYTGIIRDKLGRKMSKMLGNSPNPLDLIAKYGADALRFGTMRSAPLGLDIRFDEQQVELGRNFCNKLWNAARLRLSQQADGPALRISDLRAADLGSDDKAILMRVEATIRDIHALYEGYEFNQVANRLYELFWSYYCDWYLEAAKTALYGADARRKAVTLAVMDHVLNAILRLLHPYMPFITEELWQALGFGVAGEAPPQTGEERREGERGRGTPLACPRILPPPGQDNGHASGVPLRPTSQGSIQFTPWPECLDEADLKRLGLDAARLRFVEQKYEAVTAGRNLRATYNIPSNRKVRFAMSGEGDWQADAGEVAVLRTLLNAEAIEFVKQAPPHTVSTVTPLGTFYLSLEGLVDAAAETQRLGKQIARLEKELEGVTAKLADEGFTSRAPAKAVDKHRARMDELKADIAKIRAQIAALGGK